MKFLFVLCLALTPLSAQQIMESGQQRSLLPFPDAESAYKGFYQASLVAFVGANVADVASSWGRPEAIAVMAELGIDISGHRSKSVDEFHGRPFRYVITVCDHARDTCPAFPTAAERLHWSFEDPAAVEGPEPVRLEAFRRIRDQIRERLKGFVRSGPHL